MNDHIISKFILENWFINKQQQTFYDVKAKKQKIVSINDELLAIKDLDTRYVGNWFRDYRIRIEKRASDTIKKRKYEERHLSELLYLFEYMGKINDVKKTKIMFNGIGTYDNDTYYEYVNDIIENNVFRMRFIRRNVKDGIIIKYPNDVLLIGDSSVFNINIAKNIDINVMALSKNMLYVISKQKLTNILTDDIKASLPFNYNNYVKMFSKVFYTL